MIDFRPSNRENNSLSISFFQLYVIFVYCHYLTENFSKFLTLYKHAARLGNMFFFHTFTKPYRKYVYYLTFELWNQSGFSFLILK